MLLKETHTLQIVSPVTHGGPEIKRSTKICTFYYYCISWVLNRSTDLGLSHHVWLLGGSNNTKFRSSAGSRSASRCRLAAGGAKPENKLLSLHLPKALTRNIVPAFNSLGGPSSGAACFPADPNPAAVPASRANCAFVQSPDKWKEKTRIDFIKIQLKPKPRVLQKSWECCLCALMELVQRAFLLFFFFYCFLKHIFQLRPKGFKRGTWNQSLN